MSDVMNKRLQDRLYALLKRDDLTVKLNGYDQSFKDVVKYLLPRLLEGPIHHLKFIFNVIEVCQMSSAHFTCKYILQPVVIALLYCTLHVGHFT